MKGLVLVSASTQVASSVAGDLIVYVMCPLIVLTIVGFVTWARNLNRQLTTQDKALALLVQAVMPEGQPSLREVVNQHSNELAFIKGQMAAAVASGGAHT